MFSVDNFYDFVDSYYGVKKSKNVLWAFSTHGSKDLDDLMPTRVDQQTYLEQRGNYSTLGCVVLHDQEPFSYGSLSTYKDSRRTDKKLWELVQHTTPEELFSQRLFSCSWPVWCHSEQNSRDIQLLKDIGIKDCHYFWHGLVSRDWFRHWRHHADINAVHPWNQRFLLYCRAFDGSREYRRTVVESLSRFRDQIRYDWKQESLITPDYSAKLVPEDASSTAVQIVLETIFNDDKIYVSEKVFKPIAMKQPFIVFAAPHTLGYLKKYGFRTFDSIWNEDYDLEVDHKVRRSKILSLIENLYRLPDREFAQIVDRCQEIVDYNHRYFYSQEFEAVLLKELHFNLQTATQQQQDRAKQDPGGIFFYYSDCIRRRGLEFTPGHLDKSVTILTALKNHQHDRYEQILKQYPWIKTLA
jgi:hypothetical protein